jgi:uncharacterized protein with FMN-binding domain
VVSRVRPRTGRRNAAVAAATGVVAALLFLYPTSVNRPAGPVAVALPAPLSTSAPEPSAPSSTPSSDPLAPASGPTTYTGRTVDTRWGPVQVEITVSDGRVVSAEAVQYPNDNGRDREINAVAVPLLDRAAVAAQSARIDTVSGATYTSDGYIGSLQSALDAAHLG